jgi:hypothetical protein
VITPTALLTKAVFVGQIISGPTGPELVIDVLDDDATTIKVHDALGREFLRTRADHGWWSVIVPMPATDDYHPEGTYT